MGVFVGHPCLATSELVDGHILDLEERVVVFDLVQVKHQFHTFTPLRSMNRVRRRSNTSTSYAVNNPYIIGQVSSAS